MKISLVTCVFNRKLQFERGIRSILQQSLLPDEIVVVDDGSTDGLKDIVDLLHTDHPIFRYVYVDHPEHRISSVPRNVGIKQSSGDIIFFTEPECLHIGDTIAQLKQKFDEDPEHTHLASQVWTIQEKIYKKLSEDNFARPITILQHPYAQLTDNTNMQNTKAPDSDWAITGQNNCAAGCFFGVRREWLEAIGGFDESFVGHGFDDFDLYERLALYGHGVIKHDDIVVIHQWHEKAYPFNIYDMAEKNGKISAENIKNGIYEVNKGKEWGKI